MYLFIITLWTHRCLIYSLDLLLSLIIPFDAEIMLTLNSENTKRVSEPNRSLTVSVNSLSDVSDN